MFILLAQRVDTYSRGRLISISPSKHIKNKITDIIIIYTHQKPIRAIMVELVTVTNTEISTKFFIVLLRTPSMYII